MSRNKSGVIFKLDFKKVYDKVSWDFLWFIMSRMGFGDRWIQWIRCCVSRATVFVLINGTPSPKFNMEQDLRQGCPLSPLLFNLVDEAFLTLIS